MTLVTGWNAFTNYEIIYGPMRRTIIGQYQFSRMIQISKIVYSEDDKNDNGTKMTRKYCTRKHSSLQHGLRNLRRAERDI